MIDFHYKFDIRLMSRSRNIVIRHEHILFEEKPGILEPSRVTISFKS